MDASQLCTTHGSPGTVNEYGIDPGNPVEEDQPTGGEMGEEPVVTEGRQPDREAPEPEQRRDHRREGGG